MKNTFLIALSFILYSENLWAQCSSCDPNWGDGTCQWYGNNYGVCETICRNGYSPTPPWVQKNPKATTQECINQCNTDCGCCD